MNDIFSIISAEGKTPDSDTMLILIFIFLLYKNEADLKLLLALGYILL